jgi:hypothetical protein
MKLITNGCSFTWGAEILPFEIGCDEGTPKFLENPDYYTEYRNTRTYAHHLHNKLETISYKNLAYGGASNKRIIRTTLEYFMPKILNNEDVSDHIAVIQWSEPFREEIYYEDGKYYTLSARGFAAEPSMMEKLNHLYYDYNRGKLLLHDKNFTNQFIHDIILMASFLELHKIKYVFCHIASSFWKFPELDDTIASKMNWSGGTYKNSSLRTLMDNTQREKKIVLCYPQNHPNIEGHKFIAETLYKRLKELYNL